MTMLSAQFRHPGAGRDLERKNVYQPSAQRRTHKDPGSGPG
jgi:hypothetical protein